MLALLGAPLPLYLEGSPLTSDSVRESSTVAAVPVDRLTGSTL